MVLQGAFVKIGDFIKFKGSLVEFLENRRSWENQKPPENHQKSGLFWASPFTMHLVFTLLNKQNPPRNPGTIPWKFCLCVFFFMCYSPPDLLCKKSICQARKESTNPNFWVRICSGGVGVFHVKGLGPKKFGMCLETTEIKLFRRDIPGFCCDIPEVPEKLEKKKYVFSSRPLIWCFFCCLL